MVEGIFPSQSKTARVIPIHKGGDIKDPSNYRPISILPVLSKIFEKHVNSQIHKYLTTNKLLHKLQCGFREGYSCVDSLHKLISDCLSARSDGNFVAMMFLDFKKAFDCVDHKILLDKLTMYGITGKLHSLIKSFLTDRTQFVAIQQGTRSSTILPIDIGVPQGSILAPSLFLVYVNDLLSYTLHSKAFAYADDTVFVTKSDNFDTLNDLCDTDLHLIESWCRNNRMLLNIKKSHYMLVQPSHRATSQDLDLKINHTKLNRNVKTKLLGFTLNDSLTWDDHVDQICSKINKSLALFQKCRAFLDSKSSRNFYFQYVFCHMIYGIRIYGNLSPQYILERIYLLQKRAFRLIANINHIPYHLVHTRDLHTSLGLIPFPLLAGHFTCIFGFQILHLIAPDFLLEGFIPASSKTFFRDKHLLHYHTDQLRQKITTTFNSLPIQIRSATKLTHFKQQLSKHFISY